MAEKLKKAGLTPGEFKSKSLGAAAAEAKEEKLKGEEKKEEGAMKPQEKRPFTRKNAEDLVKAVLGEDVFKRPEGTIKTSKPQSLGAAAAKEKQKSYIQKEIDRLGEELVSFKRKAREASSEDVKKVYEGKVKFYQEEFEKAKKVRDRIKDSSKINEKKEIKIQSQVKADMAETQPKTYGKTYAKESTPEDALEKGQILKNLERQEFKKEEDDEINKIEVVSPMGGKIFGEEKIKEAQEAKESLRKTREKIAESERVVEPGDIYEAIETTPGEEILTEEEKKIEAEKHLAAVEKQENKIEEKIKQEKPWVREKIEKAANWYKKQPLWKKIIVSVGCIGAASASAFIGGAAGATIATAAFTGSISQRALGGLATFITAEGLLKKSAEKGGRERTKAEATRHTVEAAVLGILVGSGQAARGVKEIADVTGVSDLLKEAYEYWVPKSWAESLDKIKLPATEQKIATASKIPQEVPSAPKVATVFAPKFQIAENMEIKKGDSIWSVAKRYLESNDEFQKLGGADVKAAEALQTYNIDRVKDIILANPEKYGLAAGIDTQDLTNLSVDDLKNIKWGEALNDAIEEKGGLLANLPQDKIDSIVQNNETLKEFFENNPKAPLESDQGPQYTPEELEIQAYRETYGWWDKSDDEIKELMAKMRLGETVFEKPINFDSIKNFLENKAKISVDKSSWLTEKFLENHKVGEILESGFAKPQGVDVYTTAKPEWGSPKWWEIEEKEDFQNQVEKILRSIPVGERAELKKISLLDFFKKHLAK